MKSKIKSFHNNEDGILLMDFLFSFMILLGFSIILFSISMTLMVSDVLQYVTFSAARVYAVADDDIETSRNRALAKFQSLFGSDVIQPLIKNRWFIVKGDPVIGDFSYFAQDQNRSSFHGVELKFQAKILDKNLPLIGSTNKSVEGGAFETAVRSFLGKEPSLKDCQTFNRVRKEMLRSISENQSIQFNNYVEIADNGC